MTLSALRSALLSVVLLAAAVAADVPPSDGFADDFGQKLEASNVASYSKDYDQDGEVGWSSWGGNLLNARNYDGVGSERIDAYSVPRLAMSGYIDAASGVAGPVTTTGDHALYFADMNGLVHCSDRFTGASIWSFNLAGFLTKQGVSSNVSALASRSAPSIVGSYVYVGSMAGSYVLKLNRFTGALRWAKQVSTHPYAVLIQSPRVYGNGVYIGVASNEDLAPNKTFVGSFHRLDRMTGDLVWSRATQPAGGYTGGAVVGGEPPVDVARGRIIIATGSQTGVPQAVSDCRVAAAGDPAQVAACRQPGDLAESIVALDLATGAVAWTFSKSPVEAWTLACGIVAPIVGALPLPRNTIACPQTPDPNVDYGMAPIFVAGRAGITPGGKDMLVTGQKSGIVWALSAETGALLWSYATGPGGPAGGLMFGSATDGKNYFYAQANAAQTPFKMWSTYNSTRGHVGSLSLLNGATKWKWELSCLLNSPLTHANGLVYVGCGQLPGSTAVGGQLHVHSAVNGAHLFQKLSMVGSRVGGVTVVDGQVYAPAGYTDDKTAGGVYVLAVPA